MQPEEMIKMPAEISALMTERLGIRGKALSPKLRRARRLLPKQVREAAQLLADSEPRLQNPKLMNKVDGVALAQAYYRCKVHLEGIDHAGIRAHKRADLLSTIAFNLLFLFVLVTAFILWRGLI